VEAELKKVKDAKNKDGTVKMKETTKDMVAQWNKDVQGCSKDAT
jgi:hypothetical protein